MRSIAARAQVQSAALVRLAQQLGMDYLGALPLALSIRTQADAQLSTHDLTYAQWLPLFKISRCPTTTVASLARDLAARRAFAREGEGAGS